MNRYSKALEYLYTQLPMFQRTGPAAYKHSLGNTLQLDEMYGHPHRQFKSIHVAGTNGKGSVSHMLAAILQSAGYRTGLYTSPHLKDFRERIRVNGVMVPESYVASWTDDFQERNLEQGIEPSFFELTVAMAFDYFAQEKVDIAVVEVGLGGRLDSTNIITPVVGVITNISYDHMSLLGDTLPLIAAEKAGIIKPGVPVVIGQRQAETEDVFVRKASAVEAPLYFASDAFSAEYGMLDREGNQIFNFRKNEALLFPSLKLDLPGIYQRLNVPPVLKTVEILRAAGWEIPDEALYKGLAAVKELTGLMGRWQVLGANPRIVCDTGHNEDGIRQVVTQIRQTPFRKLHIVLGVVADKDPDKVLALLPPEAVYYFCRADIPRAMDPVILKGKAAEAGLTGDVYGSVLAAYDAARAAAGTDDFIFVGGSTFVVAEIL
jgi:dihydrofolate synthase / folylpolyglutamate synthase